MSKHGVGFLAVRQWRNAKTNVTGGIKNTNNPHRKLCWNASIQRPTHPAA